MKGWIIVGVTAWVTYIVLKNQQSSDRIKVLEQNVKDLVGNAAQDAADLVKKGINYIGGQPPNVQNLTTPPATATPQPMPNSIFPNGVMSNYNSTRNGTGVSPAPVQVLMNG